MKKNNTTNKGGRPRKRDSKKEVSRTVRFSPEEDSLLSEKVRQYGGSRSDYIRRATLEAKIVSVPAPGTIRLFKEYMLNLRKIGTNLNAIAHRANTVGSQFGYFDLQEAKKECESLLRVCRTIQLNMMPKDDR